MFARFGIEGGLDLFTVRWRRGTVIDEDPIGCQVGTRSGCFKLLLEIALRIVVLGENDAACVVPLRPGFPELRTQVSPNPFYEFSNASIRQSADRFCEFGHLI